MPDPREAVYDVLLAKKRRAEDEEKRREDWRRYYEEQYAFATKELVPCRALLTILCPIKIHYRWGEMRFHRTVPADVPDASDSTRSIDESDCDDYCDIEKKKHCPRTHRLHPDGCDCDDCHACRKADEEARARREDCHVHHRGETE